MNINKFYYKKSKLQQLRGFCATVKNNCSIRDGAKELGIEESAISTQIRYLELELGVKLFNRVHGRLFLNDDGVKVYDKAVSIISEVDNLFNHFLMREDKDYNNIIKIASYDGILIKIIPLINKYIKIIPDMKFKIYNITKKEAFTKLLEDTLDIIIYPCDSMETIPTEFNIFDLSPYKSYWCFSKNHFLAKKDEDKITKDDIKKCKFGFIKEQIMFGSFENFINENNISNQFEIINGNVEILKNFVKNELLVTILSEAYINEEDIKHMSFKDNTHFFPSRRYKILVNKKHKESISNFVDFLNKNLQNIINCL